MSEGALLEVLQCIDDQSVPYVSRETRRGKGVF